MIFRITACRLASTFLFRKKKMVGANATKCIKKDLQHCLMLYFSISVVDFKVLVPAL